MRITVDNLMHQLLNPQVNFEIARVVAERMGLVQMPSPHMTVKYHPGVVEGRNSVYLRRDVVCIRPEGLVRLANAGLWPEELFEMDDL